jgi:lysocardiolipin and lysophospholipid acyltransferase
VRLGHWYEVGQIFVVLAAFALLANIGAKMWNLAIHGSLGGKG